MCNGFAYQKARERISSLFELPVENINASWRFGHELKPSFTSDFRKNQIDHLQFDVDEVKVAVENKINIPDVIETVDDFCTLIKQFYEVDSKYCESLFMQWDVEFKMKKKPFWRRMVFEIAGL